MYSLQQITAIPAAAVLFVTILWICCCVESFPESESGTIGCNTGVYVRGDPFAKSLEYVLADLERATPKRPGYDYRNISPYPYAFAYGHATCSRNLTSSACAACLGSAKTALLDSCVNSVGADFQFTDCSMRYEQYPFGN